MAISAIPSALQALPSTLIQPTVKSSATRVTEPTIGDTRLGVIISIAPFAQSSGPAAGANGDQIAASAREHVGTYYKLKSEIPNLRWDDVAKDVGEMKALDIRKAYEQRIEDFGKTAKLEAEVAGVPSTASAIKVTDLPAASAPIGKQPPISSSGQVLRSTLESFGLSTGADAALAVLRATDVKA